VGNARAINLIQNPLAYDIVLGSQEVRNMKVKTFDPKKVGYASDTHL
jgi:hypothetical protein